MSMKRREFITMLAGSAAAWPLAVHAQQPRPRIAFLTLSSAQGEAANKNSFVEGLRALGYVEGRTVDIDYGYADGDTTRLAPLARELVALKPAVALVASMSPAFAMKSIAPALPMVCPLLSDAALSTLATSYARPAGSVTGLTNFVEGVVTKLLELALDMVPHAVRIGLLTNATGASMALFVQQFEAAARSRGVTLMDGQARVAEDLAPAFDSFAKGQAQAIIITPNALFLSQRSRIIQLALSARLPTISSEGESVRLGGLASYGVDPSENFRRAAAYVDKILKGAKPGDMPIEFATKLELVINLKTANALGITVPATILGRADEVIE
jgi:putative ABC transport system substrate-binding protein